MEMFVSGNSGYSPKYSVQIMVEHSISIPVFVDVLFSLASFGTLGSEFGEEGTMVHPDMSTIKRYNSK
jgi:hypothetical protein